MKKTGRLLAVSAAAICALGTMTSCNKTGFKVGLLCLHGQTSTYDKNFIDAFVDVCTKDEYGFNLKEGVGYEIRTDVKEDYNDIYTAAKEWAEDGYSMVFADSFGHQYGLIDVAREYPDTEFCHATGTTALLNHDAGEFIPDVKSYELKNYHNAFANIYEGRYLAGVAAGAKMIEDIEAKKYKLEDAKIGYVGAWPYAEVISGYTSFYLGACSQFDDAYGEGHRPTMYVKYTYSWYDYGAEKEAAFELIRKYGCKLISQHADSMGAPQACAAEKIPNVCYNISTKAKTPDTYLYGSKINWRPYFAYIIGEAKKKYDKDPGYKEISTDFVGELGEESEQEDYMVNTLEFGNIATDGIKAKVAAAREGLLDGNIHVFDCSKFTVTKHFYGENDPKNRNPFAAFKYDDGKMSTDASMIEGATVEAYQANVLDDPKYFSDTWVTKTDETGITYIDESGYDNESTKVIEGKSTRSAPYFELIIDGIETLN